MHSLCHGEAHSSVDVLRCIPFIIQEAALAEELTLVVGKVLLVHHVLGIPTAILAVHCGGEQGGKPAGVLAASQTNHQAGTNHL
jgi:hypothetical protein